MSKNRWDPDWFCPLCQTTVHGRKGSCVKCKTPKLKPGDWVCRCRTFNFAARLDCVRCHMPKPNYCICENPGFQTMSWHKYHVNGMEVCTECNLHDAKDQWVCWCRTYYEGSVLKCDKCLISKPKTCTCDSPTFKHADHAQNEESSKCYKCCLPNRDLKWVCSCSEHAQNKHPDMMICSQCITQRPNVCDCKDPRFNTRINIHKQIVECGPCLNCQTLIPKEQPVQKKKRKDLEDRVVQLENELLEFKKRFDALEARLSHQ